MDNTISYLFIETKVFEDHLSNLDLFANRFQKFKIITTLHQVKKILELAFPNDVGKIQLMMNSHLIVPKMYKEVFDQRFIQQYSLFLNIIKKNFSFILYPTQKDLQELKKRSKNIFKCNQLKDDIISWISILNSDVIIPNSTIYLFLDKEHTSLNHMLIYDWKINKHGIVKLYNPVFHSLISLNHYH